MGKVNRLERAKRIRVGIGQKKSGGPYWHPRLRLRKRQPFLAYVAVVVKRHATYPSVLRCPRIGRVTPPQGYLVELPHVARNRLSLVLVAQCLRMLGPPGRVVKHAHWRRHA